MPLKCELSLEEAPDTFGTKELSQILGIGINAAWELTRREGFPVLKIGRRLRVSKAGLIRWMEKNVG